MKPDTASPSADPHYRQKQPFRIGNDGLVSRTMFMEAGVYTTLIPREPQAYRLFSVIMLVSSLASAFVGGLITVRNGEGDIIARFFSAKLTTDYGDDSCEVIFGRFHAISPAGGTAKFWDGDSHALFGSLPELMILPGYQVELRLLDSAVAVPEVLGDPGDPYGAGYEPAVPGTVWTKTILALEPVGT